MNKFILGAVALLGVAISAPANAQVYFGFGGGPGYGRSYDNGYRSYDNGYRSYEGGSRYYGDDGYRRSYRRSYSGGYRSCRVVRVWTGDGYRRIRRCR
jgi:hypothetical protein